MTISTERVGEVPEGPVSEYTVRSPTGMTLKLMDFGATLTSLVVPDRSGHLGEVTLAYATAAEFLRSGNPPFLGCTVGRFGNRIASGQFTLDGRVYHLARNDGGANHLHGGELGFDKRLWRAEPFRERGRAGVRLHYTSPEGEEGYPGSLAALAVYALDYEDRLTMSYEAASTAPTVINLTNHTYWNLGGSGPILDHTLALGASAYLEVDGALIPTGRKLRVEDTAFDFLRARRIGARIQETGLGYDHCFIVDGAGGADPVFAARVADPGSGRAMEVRSTQPGVQLYTGNFLDRAGFLRHRALCLETQGYPDSPNHPDFPSPVLRPGQTYRHTTIHSFTADVPAGR
jgi:aldose 1-epimerase